MSTLVPRPRRLESPDPGTAGFPVTPRTVIVADAMFRDPALRLRETLSRSTGFPLDSGQDTGAGQAIVFAADDTIDEEGYRLEVTADRVLIAASASVGAHWGVQALLQLLPPEVYRQARVPGSAWQVPPVRIADAPRFRWRGAMLDVARHFVPPREVRRFIDLLAMHRMNTLHLHLTDDQGWRLQIRRYPLLTEVGGWRTQSQTGAGPTAASDGRPHGGYYTQDDMREIVSYAAERGITVVPEIELPGHAQAAIAAYPELGVTGDRLEPWTGWGINPNVFNVEESTIEFLTNVFDEVMELFPSSFIGVGGDECPKDQWHDSPRVQERMRELGVADEEKLQSWFIGRIDEHLASRGRRLLGWDEILEGGLAPGATVLSWRGRVGAVAAARAGHDVIACPEDTVYLDYRQSDGPHEPIPIATVTTIEQVYAFDPVPDGLDDVAKSHILGGQGNVWTEHIDSPRTLDYLVFPRLCALAEALWTSGDRDFDEFSARLHTHLERLDALGVEYRRADGPLPWQRRPGIPGRPLDHEEAAAYVAQITANIA